MSGVKRETMQGWSCLLKEAHSGKPKGYSTAAEIAVKLKLSNSTAREKLKRLVLAGKVDFLDCVVNGVRTRVYKD